MAEPIDPLLLKILDACQAQAPEPLYPKPFALAESLDREVLDKAFDHLRVHGLVKLTDWVQGLGQGYTLTEEGAEILRNPALLGRPRPKPEARQESGDTEWDRGEAVRACLMEPAPPRVTRILVIATIGVFLWGWYLADQRGFGGDYFMGSRENNKVGALLYELGGISMRGVINDGEWWRLLAHSFLHRGFLHLLFNMYVLWSFGVQVESMWGWWRYLILYLFTGLTGGMTVALFDESSVGASASISGLFLSIWVWLWMNRRYFSWEVIVQMRNRTLMIIVLLLLMSYLPGVSFLGHFGGAVGGLIISVFLNLNRFGTRGQRWAGLAGIVILCCAGLGWAVLQSSDERTQNRFQTRFSQAVAAVELKLIPIHNHIALTLLKEGTEPFRADAERHGKAKEDLAEAIRELKLLHDRIKTHESSHLAAVKETSKDVAAYLDAWMSVCEECSGALAQPERWGPEDRAALTGRVAVVRAAGARLTADNRLVQSTLSARE